MSALYVVLPLAVFISALAVGAFLWAARRGQMDDLETPALRMLYDDDGRVSRPRAEPASPARADGHGQDSAPAGPRAVVGPLSR